MNPWLSDAEVNDLCEPLTQAAAQCRYMKDVLQLPVKRKPNGRPLVLRSSVEGMAAHPQAAGAAEGRKEADAGDRPQPNVAGLVMKFSRK